MQSFRRKSKDARYVHVRFAWQAGEFKHLLQITDFVPKTVLGRDMRISGNKIVKLLEDPGLLSLADCIRLAELTEVPLYELIAVGVDDIVS